jgi:hypothetical protein
MRIALAVLALALLSACPSIGERCAEAVVDAELAQFDAAANEVVFKASVTDGDGAPVADAVVDVRVIVGEPGEAMGGSRTVGSARTDETGVARLSVSIARLRVEREDDELRGSWLARMDRRPVHGVEYCGHFDTQAIPQEVVDLVNAV